MPALYPFIVAIATWLSRVGHLGRRTEAAAL